MSEQHGTDGSGGFPAAGLQTTRSRYRKPPKSSAMPTLGLAALKDIEAHITRKSAPLSATERRELITWRELIGDAKWAIKECMQHSYSVNVRDPQGKLHEVEIPVKPDTRAKAAIAVLAVLARNGSPISDEADVEDRAESLTDAANRALGELRRTAVIEAHVDEVPVDE